MDAAEGMEAVIEMSTPFSSLTPRELQIVTLIAQGRTTAEVAQELGINPKTVISHRLNAVHKLNARGLTVRNSVELTRAALRAGVVTLEES